MGPSESINRALNAFFNGFGIPGYLEDNIPPATPWAQPLDNPPEGYLCEYLNFEITQFCE